MGASGEADGKEKNKKDTVSLIRSKWGRKVADLWDEAYDSSNFIDHNNGLAPRISEIGLIAGAVLHILPSLEKAVQFMPLNQRSLRVMRVEISDSGQKIVGIKFPVTQEAIGRLLTGMKEVANARQGSLGSSPSYIDTPFSPIDEKAMAWATTEKKTMKSFFSAASSSTSDRPVNSNGSGGTSKSGGRKDRTSFTPLLQNTSKKKQASTSAKRPAKKVKTANISSFFGKKSNN